MPTPKAPARMARRRGPFCGRAVAGEVNMVNVMNEFGVVGLGRMGGGLAMQALEKKMVVAGFELRGASAHFAISQAVMQLFSSRDDRKNWARAIAMMRHGFGGHVYGADAATRQERREGRVGDTYRGDE